MFLDASFFFLNLIVFEVLYVLYCFVILAAVKVSMLGIGQIFRLVSLSFWVPNSEAVLCFFGFLVLTFRVPEFDPYK